MASPELPDWYDSSTETMSLNSCLCNLSTKNEDVRYRFALNKFKIQNVSKFLNKLEKLKLISFQVKFKIQKNEFIFP